MLPRAIDVALIQTTQDALTQTVTQARQLAGFLSHLFLRDRAGLAQANDSRDVQRAGAHAALVAAAVDAWRKLHARIFAPHIQRAHALRSVHLVTGDRHQVDVLLDHVDWNFANR